MSDSSEQGSGRMTHHLDFDAHEIAAFNPWRVPPDVHAHHRQFWRWQDNPSKASRYFGVTPRGKRWMAHLIRSSAGIACSLGCFDDEASAANAYDLVALAVYGDDAMTNFDKAQYLGALAPSGASLLQRGFASDVPQVRKAARAALAWVVAQMTARAELRNSNRKDDAGTTNALTG